MADDARLASLLYGTPTTPAKASDTPSPTQELADLFYTQPPAPVAPPDPNAWFDRYEAFKSNFNKQAEELHDTLGVSSEAREADDRALVALADTLGFDDQTMLTLREQVVRGLTQSVAPDADADETAAVQARNVAIRQTLRERLGEHGASDVISRTERFIESTPELEQLVNRGALGTRADLFLTIAQHVQDKHIR